jgi:hypothetical protein
MGQESNGGSHSCMLVTATQEMWKRGLTNEAWKFGARIVQALGISNSAFWKQCDTMKVS